MSLVVSGPAKLLDFVLVLAEVRVLLQFRLLPKREGPKLQRDQPGDERSDASGPDR